RPHAAPRARGRAGLRAGRRRRGAACRHRRAALLHVGLERPRPRVSTTHDAGVELVAWDDPDAARMRADQQLEMARLYAPEELVGDLGPDGQPWTSDVAAPLDPATVVATVVVRLDGVAVGCGSVRDISGTDDGVGGRHAAAVGEVKRVY